MKLILLHTALFAAIYFLFFEYYFSFNKENIMKNILLQSAAFIIAFLNSSVTLTVAGAVKHFNESFSAEGKVILRSVSI